ncbi:hypothetical protein [Bradyrhizobium elkanii]|uniref:hypothetical protein n=1 Tax=Bradyrhizobium elkanii TaxID=29448 RepID=UPI0004028FFD|nr:hypothetical protein [Bradyrhizobium elkanii]
MVEKRARDRVATARKRDDATTCHSLVNARALATAAQIIARAIKRAAMTPHDSDSFGSMPCGT